MVAGSGLSLMLASALGQAYFDSRNPFLAPVAPQPAPPAGGGRAGDDFGANERVPYRPAPFDGGDYNIKLGPVLIGFGASVSTVYTSNALQSQNAANSSDLSINPSLNTNLRWQITDSARLSLNLGAGYRFHLVNEQLNSLTISPNTSIDYAFSVGDVLFTVFDRLSSANTPNFRSDIIGTGNPLSVRFNRINNSAGMSAEWAPYTDLSVSSDYTYSLERGLGDSFDSLNGQSQTVSVAAFNRVLTDLTVGLSASASLNDYANGFQNSSKSYGAGPTVTWNVSEYLTVSASVRYTVIDSDRNGQIRDSSRFTGVTGSLSARHQINRVLSHSLSAGRSANGALGSNYADSLQASYQFSWRLTDFIPINFSASFQHSEQSGGLAVFAVPPGAIYLPGDSANGIPAVLVTSEGAFTGVVQTPEGLFGVPTAGQVSETYQVGVSTGYQITRNLNSSLAWNYNVNNTDFVFGDFSAHSVSLTLSYSF